MQFAKHPSSELEYAIKFYLSSAAFHEEQQHYSDPDSSLRQFLPEARAIIGNEDGLFVDGAGNSMPPCIVMEKGESLDLWMKRNRGAMDVFTCMQVPTFRGVCVLARTCHCHRMCMCIALPLG